MKKVLTLLVAALFVFTLSACDEEALLDLQNSIGDLETQLDASDVSIADLETANAALQDDITALEAALAEANTANADLDQELSDLSDSLDSVQTSFAETVAALQTQLETTTTTFTESLNAVAAELGASLDDANALIASLQAELDASNAQIDDLLAQLAVYEIPLIVGRDYYEQNIYEELDHSLTAFDLQEGDITDRLVMTSPGSFDEVGTYTVTFEVTDSDGNTADYEVTVLVGVDDFFPANYLSGVDLGKLDTENKGRVFAALERYLLENVYGGVPLYTGASRVMYSDRTTLYSPQYNGVMGFGTAFSDFTLDDSNVFMYEDVYGNVDEYTWRASYRTDPVGLNPWVIDDASTSDFIDLFSGSLYTFYFDASKTGYEINGDFATGDPIAVDPEVINGRTYATTWQIPLRNDLVWTYHPDFDASVLPAGHEVLDANDYLWTWQYALDNDWFRAIAGGGDFITNGVKNAAEYVAETKTWDEVGLKAVDDYTIELEFTSSKSMFDVKYSLVNNWQPINQELFEYLPADGAGSYGTSPETVANNGVYVFEEWTSGQFLFFSKNPDHPHADMYNYTGQQFRYIETDEQRFEEFLAGRLESSSVPSARVTEFATDPRVKTAPAATTWRLMINGFGTEAVRDQYIADHPGSGIADDYVPEPILQYLEMRKALYYGFDRYEAAVNVVKTYLPAFTYFASTYFLDAEGGISVRGTEEGAAILDDFGGGTYGYSPDAAVAYFESAVARGIADGFYTAGTPEAYTVISLDLYYASSGNTGAQNMVAELKQQYESLLVDDANYVRVVINVNDVEFPNNYYDYMMVAAMDLGIGGISGGLLDAPGFLDVFQDDNISGFTLNWGIDTHSVNIPVTYVNLDGDTVFELWSYNALVQALNNKKYVRDGVLQSVFDSKDELIDAYLDMAGTSRDSAMDGANVALYILGDTMENLAADAGVDAVTATIIVTADGGNILYVVQEDDGGFELYGDGEYALFTDAEAAIKAHSGYPLGSVDGQLVDDAAIAGNAYLSGLGYSTLQEIADDTGAPIDYMEVYAVTWAGNYTGSDAYVVLHIGDYFVGWAWL
ncbi:ABC transporter substrate-binding protein [Candidatus Xianfuyuplasma coldseepsis]|uniref:Solute-binding protein family 5 domain-containing protein n=1 Tax=Candidatus Xianfuyuplasma coldseepsis TaxID=2782163 RepID=A0A7L7KR86_9MOLU|nr:ABC transporter substrate-binding protein [Xianfuyuplasma coldseepsis]QMS85341.1 hypothetical protein G4Z02_06095 [Xianfuyuplasma coldseepsis]